MNTLSLFQFPTLNSKKNQMLIQTHKIEKDDNALNTIKISLFLLTCELNELNLALGSMRLHFFVFFPFKFYFHPSFSGFS